jgi:hypothetical protein
MGSGVNIALGAIIIYAAPGQVEDTIARRVIDKIGVMMRDKSLTHSSQIEPAW